MKSNVLTINETARRLKEENMGVSTYTLRLWVKTGKLPHQRVGKKVLLYYPNVVGFLCTQADENVGSKVLSAQDGFVSEANRIRMVI